MDIRYLLETIRQDLRYSLRTFAGNRKLTAVVIISLALGIGANTAIFSVINSVMISTLPVREPEQLMMLSWTAKAFPVRFVDSLEGDSGKDSSGRIRSMTLSSALFGQLQTQDKSFSDTLAFSLNSDRVNVSMSEGANPFSDDALAQAVSGNYFQVLGLNPALGRTILPSDDSAAAPPVAMVSAAFWQRRLAADPGVAGKSIVINGVPIPIVGVVPSQFTGLRPGVAPDIWLPLSVHLDQYNRQFAYALNDPKVWWLGVVGRLKPGVSQAQATAEAALLFRQYLLSGTDDQSASGDLPVLTVEPAKRGLNNLREQFSAALFLLMGLVGLVLLIACANVAGLLLARAESRKREIAIRFSLGAARSRIVRQMITESIVLAFAGGLAGLLFARWASSILVALLASGRDALFVAVRLDGRILAFCATASILSGIAFGLGPALRATRSNLARDARGGTRFLTGKLLVGGQVALCLLLLTSAGLFLRTLQNLLTVDAGFDPRHLIVFNVKPGLNGYKDARLVDFYADLQRRLEALPGIQSVTYSQFGPIGSGGSSGQATLPGRTDAAGRTQFYRHWIGLNYVDTIGLRLLQGREIGPQDVHGSQRVVVINELLARNYFKDENPLGRTLNMGSAQRPYEAEVVGVVSDSKYNNIRDDAKPIAYMPYLQQQSYSTSMTFQLRAASDSPGVQGAIQRTVRSLDKDIPLTGLRSETEVIDSTLFLERTFALLSASFAFIALLLACIGLYGTVSFTVAQRTKEIGVRIALGARSGSILRMVILETMGVVAVGIVLGIPLVWATQRILQTQLFGLPVHDARTIAAAIAVVVLTTLLAGYLPARRAARINPLLSLRQD